jgi:hypothetical protein
MMFPQIRCYHTGATVPQHSFFILCKGSNAGKPGFYPWPNSFLVVCSNQEYCNFFFWLIYGVHQLDKFKIRHRGTAVPFINLSDVRDTVREVAPLIHPDWSRFKELLVALEKCSQLKSTLAQQIIATEKLQAALLHKYFSELKKSP